MPDNPNQPKEYDAVLGGQNPHLIHAAVLGGIEGVRKRFASPVLEIRIAALADALKYGQKGLDLVLQALQDESMLVKSAAYFLIKDRQEAEVKQQLNKILPFFDFEVVTVDAFGEINSRRRHCAQYFTEDLGNGVALEMVSIPGGTFLMGSPETEKGRYDIESPQHPVTVKPFFMGKYPVTQAQWKAVPVLPQINLALNPDPAYYKGTNLPINISWDQAQKFCARLTKKTGKTYRLTSEAEWEYACRAGTTTPFHFGETITSELANYNGHSIYASEQHGTYRAQTTAVGSFPPNAFGLYDMHGNILEWCADPWHKNYQGAPSDGSVWEASGNNRYRLLRGGSWGNDPMYCRSAYRNYYVAVRWFNVIGFRVVCSSAWTH